MFYIISEEMNGEKFGLKPLNTENQEVQLDKD